MNAVAPGMTETPMTAGMLGAGQREGAARQYPLGGIQRRSRWPTTMAWLLSERGAHHRPGDRVDGGFTTVRPLVR